MGFYAEVIFPWVLEHGLDKPEIHARRAALVGPASGDVLEIGFGTGATLRHYHKDNIRSLCVVEPSEGMNRKARARIAASGMHVHSEMLGGEHLPFADARFDCVVTSLTLCTVSDPKQVLAEIWRVLRPGGEFRFLEHVLSENPARAKWQNRFNPVQKIIAVGCNVNRDTVRLIRDAGFELAKAAQEIETAFPFAPYMPLVQAVARKPA